MKKFAWNSAREGPTASNESAKAYNVTVPEIMKEGQGTMLEQGIKRSEEKKQEEYEPSKTISTSKSPPPEVIIPEEVKDYVEGKSAAKALKYGRTKGMITDFEEREIFDYSKVYFIGKPGVEKF